MGWGVEVEPQEDRVDLGWVFFCLGFLRVEAGVGLFFGGAAGD